MVSTQSARNVAALIAVIRNPRASAQPDLRAALRTLAVAIDPGSRNSELAGAVRQQLLNATSLPELFALFEHPDAEVVEDAGALVDKVLGQLPFGAIADELEEHLRAGLAHPNCLVRQLALRQVVKALGNKADFQKMLDAKILPDLLRCLDFPDSIVAQAATDLLKQIADDDVGLSAIFAESGSLNHLMGRPPTVKLRLYELAAQIAIASDAAFGFCATAGLLDGLMAASTGGDLLMRLNAVEIFGTLAQSRKGFEFIERSGAFQTFAIDLSPLTEGRTAEKTDLTLGLVQCAELNFYGRIAGLKSVDFEVVEREHGILPQVEGAIANGNRDTKEVALSVIGHIGSARQGLKILAPRMEDELWDLHPALQKLLDIYSTGTVDERVVALRSLCGIFALDEMADGLEGLQDRSARARRVFSAIDGGLQKLTSECQQTFEELRVAAYAILRKLVDHAWSRQEMAKSKQIVDFLINRRSDGSRVGREWKFAIVQALALAPDTETVFGSANFNRFRRYVNEGPFYTPTEAALLVETEV